MWSDPKVVERQPQPCVAIKVLVTMHEIGQVVPPLTGEVFGWLADHGGTQSGPPFWKYNVIDMERDLEIEAGVAVEQPVPGDDRVSGRDAARRVIRDAGTHRSSGRADRCNRGPAPPGAGRA